jgi:hypothetical protein
MAQRPADMHERRMFVPQCIAVPQRRRVTLRFAAPDVIHGILVTGTNVNTMVVPGFVDSRCGSEQHNWQIGIGAVIDRGWFAVEIGILAAVCLAASRHRPWTYSFPLRTVSATRFSHRTLGGYGENRTRRMADDALGCTATQCI